MLSRNDYIQLVHTQWSYCDTSVNVETLKTSNLDDVLMKLQLMNSVKMFRDV